MKQVFNNNKEVTQMIWETNPLKRNGSTIKFVAHRNIEFKPGDCIVGSKKELLYSLYTIPKINSVRESSMTGKIYIEAECDWRWATKEEFAQ
jgi:hypothetical protein